MCVCVLLLGTLKNYLQVNIFLLFLEQALGYVFVTKGQTVLHCSSSSSIELLQTNLYKGVDLDSNYQWIMCPHAEDLVLSHCIFIPI